MNNMSNENKVSIGQSSKILPMTVGMLIDLLDGFDPNAQVEFDNGACFWVSTLKSDEENKVVISSTKQSYLTPTQVKIILNALNDSVCENNTIFAIMVTEELCKLRSRNILITIRSIFDDGDTYNVGLKSDHDEFIHTYRYAMSLNKIKYISVSINNSKPGKFVFDKKENKFIAVENITLINS